jgi:hypothetical protein
VHFGSAVLLRVNCPLDCLPLLVVEPKPLNLVGRFQARPTPVSRQFSQFINNVWHVRTKTMQRTRDAVCRNGKSAVAGR